MKWRKKPVRRIWGSPELRRVTTLSALCAFGIIGGCFAAGRLSPQATQQLQAYLAAYTRLQLSPVDGVMLFRAFAVYFRYCLCIFLLSFTAVGLYLIPLVFAFQGFSLAFAVASFFCCFAVRPITVLSLFFFRAVIVLPIMLYFGSAAMQSAAARESRTASGFWRRFGISVCVLLLGAILEITVVPHLFSLTFPYDFFGKEVSV